jgi:hypothetical protein
VVTDVVPEYAFADHALSRRLERAEAAANASFVEARSQLSPATRATWLDVDGTWAMFDGVGSPLTQSFGLGLFSTPLPEHFDALEAFFRSRRSSVQHEVSPLADPQTIAMLAERGYVPLEHSTVLHRPLARSALAAVAPTVIVRPITVDEVAVWADISAAGWSEYPELGDFMRDLGELFASSRNVTCFVASIEDRLVATGALALHDGVALLAGASTVPSFRGRGAQNALLAARLAFAVDHGCDLACMATQPGSASQRNAERQGFRVAYTRTKWIHR